MKPLLPIALFLSSLLLSGCETTSSSTTHSASATPSKAEAENRPPKILFVAKPTYPSSLFDKGVNGAVTLEFVIGTDGKPLHISAIEATNDAFANSAISALKNGKFQPGLKGGKPVAVKVKLDFKFDTNEPQSKINRPQK